MLVGNDIRGHLLDDCRVYLGFVRACAFTPDHETDTIWQIIKVLDDLKAEPEDIGASYDELEQLLKICRAPRDYPPFSRGYVDVYPQNHVCGGWKSDALVAVYAKRRAERLAKQIS